MADGYQNRFLDQILAARRARQGTSEGYRPYSKSNYSGKSPAGGTLPPTGNEDLDRALANLDAETKFGQAIGNEGANDRAKGDEGLFTTMLDYLGRPASAVMGGLTGALGMDDGNGDDTDDGAFDRIGQALGGRKYGAGDFGALKWDEDDTIAGKTLKGITAFGIDVALDPLNLIGGTGLVGRGAARTAGGAVRNTGADTLRNGDWDERLFGPRPTGTGPAPTGGALERQIIDGTLEPEPVTPFRNPIDDIIDGEEVTGPLTRTSNIRRSAAAQETGFVQPGLPGLPGAPVRNALEAGPDNQFPALPAGPTPPATPGLPPAPGPKGLIGPPKKPIIMDQWGHEALESARKWNDWNFHPGQKQERAIDQDVAREHLERAQAELARLDSGAFGPHKSLIATREALEDAQDLAARIEGRGALRLSHEAPPAPVKLTTKNVRSLLKAMETVRDGLKTGAIEGSSGMTDSYKRKIDQLIEDLRQGPPASATLLGDPEDWTEAFFLDATKFMTSFRLQNALNQSIINYNYISQRVADGQRRLAEYQTENAMYAAAEENFNEYLKALGRPVSDEERDFALRQWAAGYNPDELALSQARAAQGVKERELRSAQAEAETVLVNDQGVVTKRNQDDDAFYSQHYGEGELQEYRSPELDEFGDEIDDVDGDYYDDEPDFSPLSPQYESDFAPNGMPIGFQKEHPQYQSPRDVADAAGYRQTMYDNKWNAGNSLKDSTLGPGGVATSKDEAQEALFSEVDERIENARVKINELDAEIAKREEALSAVHDMINDPQVGMGFEEVVVPHAYKRPSGQMVTGVRISDFAEDLEHLRRERASMDRQREVLVKDQANRVDTLFDPVRRAKEWPTRRGSADEKEFRRTHKAAKELDKEAEVLKKHIEEIKDPNGPWMKGTQHEGWNPYVVADWPEYRAYEDATKTLEALQARYDAIKARQEALGRTFGSGPFGPGPIYSMGGAAGGADKTLGDLAREIRAAKMNRDDAQVALDASREERIREGENIIEELTADRDWAGSLAVDNLLRDPQGLVDLRRRLRDPNTKAGKSEYDAAWGTRVNELDASINSAKQEIAMLEKNAVVFQNLGRPRQAAENMRDVENRKAQIANWEALRERLIFAITEDGGSALSREPGTGWPHVTESVRTRLREGEREIAKSKKLLKKIERGSSRFDKHIADEQAEIDRLKISDEDIDYEAQTDRDHFQGELDALAASPLGQAASGTGDVLRDALNGLINKGFPAAPQGPKAKPGDVGAYGMHPGSDWEKEAYDKELTPALEAIEEEFADEVYKATVRAEISKDIGLDKLFRASSDLSDAEFTLEQMERFNRIVRERNRQATHAETAGSPAEKRKAAIDRKIAEYFQGKADAIAKEVGDGSLFNRSTTAPTSNEMGRFFEEYMNYDSTIASKHATDLDKVLNRKAQRTNAVQNDFYDSIHARRAAKGLNPDGSAHMRTEDQITEDLYRANREVEDLQRRVAANGTSPMDRAFGDAVAEGDSANVRAKELLDMEDSLDNDLKRLAAARINGDKQIDGMSIREFAEQYADGIEVLRSQKAIQGVEATTSENLFKDLTGKGGSRFSNTATAKDESLDGALANAIARRDALADELKETRSAGYAAQGTNAYNMAIRNPRGPARGYKSGPGRDPYDRTMQGPGSGYASTRRPVSPSPAGEHPDNPLVRASFSANQAEIFNDLFREQGLLNEDGMLTPEALDMYERGELDGLIQARLKGDPTDVGFTRFPLDARRMPVSMDENGRPIPNDDIDMVSETAFVDDFAFNQVMVDAGYVTEDGVLTSEGIAARDTGVMDDLIERARHRIWEERSGTGEYAVDYPRGYGRFRGEDEIIDGVLADDADEIVDGIPVDDDGIDYGNNYGDESPTYGMATTNPFSSAGQFNQPWQVEQAVAKRTAEIDRLTQDIADLDEVLKNVPSEEAVLINRMEDLIASAAKATKKAEDFRVSRQEDLDKAKEMRKKAGVLRAAGDEVEADKLRSHAGRMEMSARQKKAKADRADEEARLINEEVTFAEQMVFDPTLRQVADTTAGTGDKKKYAKVQAKRDALQQELDFLQKAAARFPQGNPNAGGYGMAGPVRYADETGPVPEAGGAGGGSIPPSIRTALGFPEPEGNLPVPSGDRSLVRQVFDGELLDDTVTPIGAIDQEILEGEEVFDTGAGFGGFGGSASAPYSGGPGPANRVSGPAPAGPAGPVGPTGPVGPGDPYQMDRQNLLEQLAMAGEKGYNLKRGRGVRQEILKVLEQTNLSPEDAALLRDEIFSGLSSEIRGGFGVQVPFGLGQGGDRFKWSTRGGGQNLDDRGLGGVAEMYYKILNATRATAPYRAVANRLGGHDGELAGKFLRNEISFEEYYHARNSTEARMSRLGELRNQNAIRLQAMQAIADEHGEHSEEIKKAAKEYWGKGNRASFPGLKAAEIRAAKQIANLADESMKATYLDYMALGEYTKYLTLDDLEKRFLKNYQPRVLTKESQAEFDEFMKRHPGQSPDGFFDPTTQRKSDLYNEMPDKFKEAVGPSTPLTNMLANQKAKGQGKDTVFIEDPIEAAERHMQALAGKIGRLTQVKTLMDGGILQRHPGKVGGKFTADYQGKKTEWVSIGGENMKGAVLNDLYVPSHLRDMTQRLLSSDPIRANKFVDEVYRPLLSSWKTWATVGRGPGYHVRNGIGAATMNYLGGVTASDHKMIFNLMSEEAKVREGLRDLLLGKKADVPAEVKKAYDTMLRANKGVNFGNAENLSYANLEDLVTDVMKAKFAGTKVGGRAGSLFDVRQGLRANRVGEDNILLQDLSEDMIRDGQYLRRNTEHPGLYATKDPDELTSLQQKANKIVDNPWIRWNTKRAQQMESYFRGAAFLAGARRFGIGDGGQGADFFSKSLHFSYDNLSKFERDVMKHALPFYTFMRNNIPTVLQYVAKQPGKAGMIGHLQYELENQFGMRDPETGELDEAAKNFLPNWTAERLGFPTMFNGRQPVVAMAESPFTDLNKMFNTQSGAQLVDWNELQNSSNPFAKALIESIAKKDLNTEASLDKQIDTPWYLRAVPGQTVGEEGQSQVDARLANAVSDLLPPVSVIDRLSSGAIEGFTGGTSRHEERDISNRLGILAGVPIMTYDDVQQEGEAGRRNKVLNEDNKAAAWAQGLDAQEILEVREMLRKGYPEEYIAQQIERMRMSPIEGGAQ